MNTKLIMTLAALFLAAMGIVLTFAPQNVMLILKLKDPQALSLIIQLLGAVYYAFAMLNWMAKGAIIGGIYNRPIAVANFTHFFIGGIALSKAVLSDHNLPVALSIIAGIYIILAVVFGIIMSRHPQPAEG